MLLVVLAITIITAFDLKCPEELERTFRTKFVCYNNTLVNRYSCLLDQDENVYKESCTDTADYVRPGQKYIKSGSRNNVDCSPLRYQPFKFWSHKLSKCVFKKSKCDELGQILNENGTPMSDSTCRCDYTAGFAFVTEPREKCYCMPAEEDCMCYIMPCRSQMQLDQDYNCSSREESTLPFSCPPINKTTDKSKAPSSNKGEEKLPTIKLLSTCLLILAICLSTLLAVTVLKQYRQANTTTGLTESCKSEKDKISPEEDVNRLRIIFELLEQLLDHKEFDKDFQEELSTALPDYMQVLQYYKRDLLDNDCGILIAGETSAGKTTLINELVGKHIFFTSNLPATGTVCRIRNSKSLSVKIFPKEESKTFEKTAVDFKALKSLLKEYSYIERNPPEKIDVYLPVPILKGNVIIVDTPGIGENDNLDNILLEFLPHAVSFIFIVNASNAGGIHKDRLLRVLKTVLAKREKMPCFEPDEVIFLTNKWDIINNEKEDGDEEDPHTKTWNQIIGKLEEGWPGLKTDRIFKISLEQVKKGQKTRFTAQFEQFQSMLSETIERNKNKRIDYYFRFLQRFAVQAEMGISSRINFLESTDDECKKTILKNIETVRQLEELSKQKMKEAQEYKTKVIIKLTELLSNYLNSDVGKTEILNHPGQRNTNRVFFYEEVLNRIDTGINRWCKGEDVIMVTQDIEQNMEEFLKKIQLIIENIEKDITGFTRSVHGVSVFGFSRSALRLTFTSNGLILSELLYSFLPLFNHYSSSKTSLEQNKAREIYENWLSTFTYEHIRNSFEDNFGTEYDKLIAQIFKQEIPRRIEVFKLTIHRLLYEVSDNKNKNKSLTELNALVQVINTKIEDLKEASEM